MKFCLRATQRWILPCILAFSFPSGAHEVSPAIGEIQFLDNGMAHISIQTNLESLIADIGPQHKDTNDSPNAAKYNRLRKLTPEALQSRFQAFSAKYINGVHLILDDNEAILMSMPADIPTIGDPRLSRKSVIHLSAAIPYNTKSAKFSYAKEYGNIAVKFRRHDEQAKSVHWLVEGQLSPAFIFDQVVASRDWPQTAWSYLALGFEHIVPKGADHILFVLGLFLLSTRFRPLITQVTTFTLAHSLTLGLSIFGAISLSPTIVEPLIALSIAYIGFENIVRGKNSFSRLMLIFGFGLLHGLGFAGVLRDIGLPPADFLTALVTFNVGVEAGQLLVIACALSTVYIIGITDHPRYRQWVTIPGSVLIGVVGLTWFIQRLSY